MTLEEALDEIGMLRLLLDASARERGTDLGEGWAAGYLAAVAAMRKAVETLNWWEPGSDGCEQHRPEWDWSPDRWAHLEREAVLDVLRVPEQ